MACPISKNAEEDKVITEATHPMDTIPSMEIRLLDFLAGHELRTALFQFEDAMGPWVKTTMQRHFPDDPTTAADAATIAKQRSDLTAQQIDLSAQREALQTQLQTAKADDRGDLHRQMRGVEGEWR